MGNSRITRRRGADKSAWLNLIDRSSRARPIESLPLLIGHNPRPENPIYVTFGGGISIPKTPNAA
jgi:hypothetical protein